MTQGNSTENQSGEMRGKNQSALRNIAILFYATVLGLASMWAIDSTVTFLQDGALGLKSVPELSLAKTAPYWKAGSLMMDLDEYRLFCDANKKLGARFRFAERTHMPEETVTAQGDHPCSKEGVLVSGKPMHARAAKEYSPEMVVGELTYLLETAPIAYDKGRGYNDVLGKAFGIRYAEDAARQKVKTTYFECKEQGGSFRFMMRGEGAVIRWGELATVCDRDRQAFRVESHGGADGMRVYQFFDADPKMVENAYKEALDASPAHF